MDDPNLVERLGGEEAVRKMAAFQLQNQIPTILFRNRGRLSGWKPGNRMTQPPPQPRELGLHGDCTPTEIQSHDQNYIPIKPHSRT
jgi:hypothetical protein